MRILTTKIIPLCLLSLRVLTAAPIALSPGSLLTGQVGFSSSTLYQYTAGGSQTGSLLLAEGAPTGISGLAESLTFLNGALYVGDETGVVNRIDPASGNVILHFSTAGFGLTGLGDFQGNLLTLSFNSTAVGVYTPSGTLQKTVALQTTPAFFSWNGIASDDTSFYLADNQNGRIYNYSSSGVNLGFFDTSFLGTLSGIAYDPASKSLWVANGFGSQSVGLYQFSTSGKLAGSFLTPGISPNVGVAVVSAANTIPEPSSLILVMPLFGLGFWRIRARKNDPFHRHTGP